MEVHELAKQVQAFHEEMRTDMAVLKRGMYGDPNNKVRGLLDRQDDDEIRMDAMEDRIEKGERNMWKFTVLFNALMVAINLWVNFFKDKVS